MGKFVIGKLDKIMQKIETAETSYLKSMERVIDRGIKKIERDAKKNAPVDFGTLRAMIESELKKEGARVVGTVSAKAKYSAYVEFGTGMFVDPVLNIPPHRIFPKSAKFLVWKSRKGINVKSAWKSAGGKTYRWSKQVHPMIYARSIAGMKRKPFMRPAFNSNIEAIKTEAKNIKVLGK